MRAAVLVLVTTLGCGRVGLDLTALQGSAGSDGDGTAGTNGVLQDAGMQAGGGSGGSIGGGTGGTGGAMIDGGGAGDGGSVAPVDVCIDDVCASDVDRCPSDGDKVSPGVCGCGSSDSADDDADGTADCNDLCPDAPDRLPGGECGCAAAAADDDGDGIANCNDVCPDDGDKSSPAVCGCGVDESDSDDDGMPDCADGCAVDPDKLVAGVCGCGVDESDLDTDSDGEPDCTDACNGVTDASYVPDDSCGVGYCATYNTESSCTAGVETACAPGAPLSASDATCDGVDDDCDGTEDDDFVASATVCGVGACESAGTISCVGGNPSDSCTAGSPAANDATCDNLDDDCDTAADEDFMPYASACGVGACAAAGMVTCSSGSTVDSCTPGMAAVSDATCNDVDEDCSGASDEDFIPTASSCGQGVCASMGTITCSGGSTSNSCVAGTPATMTDGPTANGNDDDCDGDIDEDVPAAGCSDTAPKTYGPGSHANIAVPAGCTTAVVRLWGGAGASGGKSVAWTAGSGGRGGSGGYAQNTITVAAVSDLDLFVGNGGASGCNAGGVNAGAATYNGGSGATGAGAAGADGVVTGGGTGANASSGGDGGRGHYGGGGGGEGVQEQGWDPGGAQGGGGGAASVFFLNGTRTMVAGGGGGSGGASGSWFATATGGSGGDGCSGNGATGGSGAAAGGGGGGICTGTITTKGTSGVPANSGSLPAGQAAGATDSCGAGGAGYAIITFGA